MKNKLTLIMPVTWGILLLVVSAIENNLLHRVRIRPEYTATIIGKIFGGLALFDASNYMTIAEKGYTSALPGLKAFFPLYPIAMHILSLPLTPIWSPPLAAIVVGTILNIVALAFSVFLLFQLFSDDYPKRTATTAIALLLVFPFSFFFVAPYTESVFLLLSVGSIYAARHQLWFYASALAALASATRLPGLILGVVIAIEMLQSSEWNLRKLNVRYLWILLAPLGAAIYFLFLHFFGGGFRAYHQAYLVSWPNRQLSVNFLAPIAAPIWQAVAHHHIRPNDILGLGSVMFGVVGLILAIRIKMRISYLAFILLSLMLPLFSGSLDSLGRYYMLIFPLFIAYAQTLFKSPRALIAYVTVSGLATLVLMSAFISGMFVG